MPLTCTDCASIISMNAVTVSKSVMVALTEVGLFASASHFVKPDRASPWPECCIHRSIDCRGVAQLTADNKGIEYAPVVVTYCAPLIQMKDFNTPLMWTGPSHQSDSAFCF